MIGQGIINMVDINKDRDLWLDEYLSKEQVLILTDIRKLIEGFSSLTQDTRISYPLEGLIRELTGFGTNNYVDPVYLQEKIDIISREIEHYYEEGI